MKQEFKAARRNRLPREGHLDNRNQIRRRDSCRYDGLLQVGGPALLLTALLYVFGCAPAPQVATPTLDPNGGTFLHSVGVAISSATASATIRYTTDGSTPTSSQGTVYSGVFQLTASATVKAIAYKGNMADSAVASAAFIVKSTTRVSVNRLAEQGNGDSSYPSISADGRYVAFESEASNLPNTGGIFLPDTNGVSDIFVHDRNTAQTTRVSVSSAGVQADDKSRSPAVSSNGRYVAFHSEGANLVSNDNNGKLDVFVRDRGE